MLKYFTVDNFLNYFNSKSAFITSVLLKVNVFPKYFYGFKYLRAIKELQEDINYDSNLINYVNKAIDSTRFYSKYKKISSVEEFKEEIGFTNKKIILDNFNDILNLNFQKTKFVYGTTSGTSGKPMKLYLPSNRYYYELSCVHSIWKSHGWNYETRGVIRNHKLSKNKIYIIKPFTKEIVFDAFRLDEDYAKQIYNVLIRKKIKFLQCYPSSAYLFCKICYKLDLDLSIIKCIFTASEPLFDYQRKFIENNMNLKISNFYGHSEKLIIAGDSPYSKNLHFKNFYGFVELVDGNGNEIKNEAQEGELVATGFRNDGMFLIRFKTGDFAQFVGDYSPQLKKKGLVVRNIEGHRNINIIHKDNNSYTTTTALNLHGELYDKIDGIQYVQKRKGHLTVRLIKNNFFNDDDDVKFFNHFDYAMGPDGTVEINYVKSLELNRNGKFLILISDLK